MSRMPSPTAGPLRSCLWGLPRVGAPLPCAFPALPAGDERLLSSHLVQQPPVATADFSTFLRKTAIPSPASFPRVSLKRTKRARIRRGGGVFLGKMLCLFSLPRDRRGVEGRLGCPCPRPGEELRPQISHDFTFGSVFPERQWNSGCGSGLCARPVLPAPSPEVERPHPPWKMRGAGSPRGRREPLVRLSELSMEGGETAT